MIKIISLLLPALLFGETLKSMLEYAHQNNHILHSYKYAKDAKAKEAESKKSDYFPKIDIGASYKNTSDVTPFQISDIYSGYGRVEVDIYDGGIKSSQLERAKNEYKASGYDEAQAKKNLSLDIVKNFYEIQSLEALLAAKEDSKKSISEQLERVKRFYDAKLATRDDVERLQASYDTNIYEIESVLFEIFSAKKALEIKVGKKIESFEKSAFMENSASDFEVSDSVKSLEYKQNALQSSSKALEGAYYPKIKIEDTYSVFGYDNIEPTHPLKIDRQNVALISLNMRIFDYGATSEAKQAVDLSAKALSKQAEYMSSEQKAEYEISIARVNSVKLKIQSAKSALTSARSAFKTVNEKYSAGIADYITY
ncbi:MAG: transporter, partial [Sulfurimonas sp. RIFOXYD12_FULL_36_11]